MAFTPYHSITFENLGAGNVIVHNGISADGVNHELIAPGEDSGNIHSIMITNTHDTANSTVTLFLQDQPDSAASSTINIIKKIGIPPTVSLLLDEPELLAFNNTNENGYGLYLTIGADDGTNILDIIITLQ